MANINIYAYEGGCKIVMDKWDWTGLTIDGYSKPLTNGTYSSGFHAGGTAFHATAAPNTVVPINQIKPIILKGDNYVYILTQYYVMTDNKLDLYGSVNVVPLSFYNPSPSTPFDASPALFSQMRMTGAFALGQPK